MSAAPRLLLAPPGPVSDRTRVELRLGLPPGDGSARVRLAVDAETLWEGDAPAGGLARAWWPTAGKAGTHRARWSVAQGKRRWSGSSPIEVVAAPTVGLPRFTGAWVEPGAAVATAPDPTPAGVERHIRASVDAMHAVGIRFLILAYAEAGGVLYYRPLADVYGAVLDQAERRGMAVFVGLTRGDDTNLLWEFDRPDWAARNAAGLAKSTALARELHARYGHYRSFYGWYLTHEANDLPRAAAYYDPLARACRALAPERVVLVAPSGTPIASRETIARSDVDIFCYQDAVGSGYIPYENTWKPERRIAMLEEIFTRYTGWHDGLDKHIWSDLEVWEMDGKSGYAAPYPPEFARVRRQIEIEARLVPVLTAYAWHGYLHPPGAPGNVDSRARRLYAAYDGFRKARR